MSDGFDQHEFVSSVWLMVPFWILAVVLWQLNDNIFYLFNFGYIGTAIGLGLGVYSALPRRKRDVGRKMTLLLVGGYMLGFLGLMQYENMQIEGFFFYLLGGLFFGSVIHYFVAKIFGPLLFNRGWCGWACWTAMVLDLLPFEDSEGRVKGLGKLRYVHFVVSFALVVAVWYFVGFTVESQSVNELYWLLGGNAVYYVLGIGLAFYLRDNRAFCKYICPITVFLKASSKFSVLKVEGDEDECIGCGKCSDVCPMDIKVDEYVQEGSRVLSSECILCLKCVNSCPEDILEVESGVDLGGEERLKER